MENRSIILTAILFVSYHTKAQQSVGIGTTTPHNSAVLELKHTNKGLLIPRVALTGTADVATITSPAVSLLVYNTATTVGGTAVSPGYYYWNGAAWAMFSIVNGSTAGNSWLLTGNAATTDGTNFIGTTNNIPFNIRVNNQRAGRIDSTLLNTFWGYQAGNANTTGNGNTANGFAALYSNTTGMGNTAAGVNALNLNTTGSFNVASGLQALSKNTSGIQNTALGPFALYGNLSGNHNTAIGYQALLYNIRGYSNTAVGAAALLNNTIASHLVAIGDSALFNNGTGATVIGQATANTAIGSKALYSNTIGNSNTANGLSALYSNTTGSKNTSTGRETLYFNQTGNGNTANGYDALFSNQSGNNNTALGTQALENNSTGSENTATGFLALQSNVGNFNSASGAYALMSNQQGFDNTANGYQALYLNTIGAQNTAIGNFALDANITGSGNTAVGYGTDVNSSAFNNTTALGSGAIVYKSNSVQIGNSNVIEVFFGNPASTILYAGSLVTPSDERFKYDVQNKVPGLEFIKKLKPVTYYFDEQGLADYSKTGIINKRSITNISYAGEQRLHTGFLAQEVEKTANQLGYNFDGVHAPENDRGYYSLSYSQFVMPLVKAIQEQQAIIEQQDKTNALQQQQIDALLKEIKQIKKKLK
ncbi:MAG: tail fiber domain-containing protein [Ferruginibacter sp.]